MKRLRICLATTFYPPHSFGGDGVFVARLADALARDGHDVHVLHDRDAFEALTSARPAAAPAPEGVTVHTLSGGGRLDLLLSHQLGRPVGKARAIRDLLSSGFDVVHFHNVSLLGGPGVFASGDAVKLCTLHDYWSVCPMHVLWRFDRERCTRRTCFRCTLAGHRPPQLWRTLGGFERAARHVDAFIAGSETACRLLAANGFPAPVRRLGHFLPDPGPDSQSAVREPDVAARPYVITAGRLERLKGVQELIPVFRSYREADLLVAGTGTFEGELRDLARDLPNVRFLGWQNTAALGALYRGALAVIVPSLCYETFGLVAIEAFAAGTPVLVPPGGALEELVADSGGGRVYGSSEELIALMDEMRERPDVRHALGRMGYESYRANFTERTHLERYYALIDEIQAKRRGTA